LKVIPKYAETTEVGYCCDWFCCKLSVLK